MSAGQPMILGIGGTLRHGSSSERMLRTALDCAEQAGARVVAVTGAELDLPHYDPGNARGLAVAQRLIALFRECDGIIIASPGYHGSISGMIKNALDYTEEMRQDERVYFEGRAAGLIVCAHGWQATGTTLVALRSVMHALRAWPTPLGVAINSADRVLNENGDCIAPIRHQIDCMSRQVVAFARAFPGVVSGDARVVPP
jgi:FMN reductase